MIIVVNHSSVNDSGTDTYTGTVLERSHDFTPEELAEIKEMHGTSWGRNAVHVDWERVFVEKYGFKPVAHRIIENGFVEEPQVWKAREPIAPLDLRRVNVEPFNLEGRDSATLQLRHMGLELDLSPYGEADIKALCDSIVPEGVE